MDSNSNWSSVEKERNEYDKMVKSLMDSSGNDKVPPFSHFQSALMLQIHGRRDSKSQRYFDILD